MGWIDIALNGSPDRANAEDISLKRSCGRVFVIRTDEEVMILRHSIPVRDLVATRLFGANARSRPRLTLLVPGT